MALLWVLILGLSSGWAASYKQGDNVTLYVNKVGPYHNPQETYHYYTLPVCRPDKVGVRGSARHKDLIVLIKAFISSGNKCKTIHLLEYFPIRCTTSPWAWGKCWTATGWRSPCIGFPSRRTWRKQRSASSLCQRNRWVLETRRTGRYSGFSAQCDTDSSPSSSSAAFKHTVWAGGFSCLTGWLFIKHSFPNHLLNCVSSHLLKENFTLEMLIRV